DQKNSDKRLMLITNSEWSFTSKIMAYTFDGFLPGTQTWRDLFDTVIVSSAKPGFFTSSNPLYKVVDEDQGLLEPHFGSLETGGVYYGGNAKQVEESLGLSGDEILYVGDHLYGDVHYSKALLRWRTALVLQELESEILAVSGFDSTQHELNELVALKERMETKLSAERLADQRDRIGYADPMIPVENGPSTIARTKSELVALNNRIAPLSIEAGQLQSEVWGPMMRAGTDKSMFARQIERYADIYTSRVSNLLYPGPYATFRMGHLDLPHDAHTHHA
ncbi:MAG: 5'-nucleotidase domain-containing protein, partial [Actinomycetota bacterium]